MPPPIPTPIYRFTHIDNLQMFLQRGGLHAPNFTPKNGLSYKTIHDEEIQEKRMTRQIPCGPGGVIHDYVSFYFGYRSPMLFKLKSGRVAGYSSGQEPLIYLISQAQVVTEGQTGFVFSDGHGIAAYTNWYDDFGNLDRVDWDMVYERYWGDTPEDPDRQRRKQAEFLVHQFCDWSKVQSIGVINSLIKGRVETIFSTFPEEQRRTVLIEPDWYY